MTTIPRAVIRFFTILLATLVTLWLCHALVLWELNPAAWSEGARACLIWLTFVATMAVSGIVGVIE